METEGRQHLTSQDISDHYKRTCVSQVTMIEEMQGSMGSSIKFSDVEGVDEVKAELEVVPPYIGSPNHPLPRRHTERPHLYTGIPEDLGSQHRIKRSRLSQEPSIIEEVQPSMETSTKFSDVKGADEAKAELEVIVHYLRDPSHFTCFGAMVPKGVLLSGYPGTGKTMLARAVAGEAGVPFFSCRGSELEEMSVVGAQVVRDLFFAAEEQSPCIIFIDEIDRIYNWKTLNQLLDKLDGIKQNGGIFVIAAANLPNSLPKALLKPGRFDHQFFLSNPDVEVRRQILEYHMSQIPKADDIDLMIISRGTYGFSGADLANLVNVAAIKAACDHAKAVSMAHLEFAKDKIMMGSECKSAFVSYESRKRIACHEGGHFLVALHTEGTLPVHKATIVPPGRALCMVSELPKEDDASISLGQMLAQLDVAMGGLVAEELMFGRGGVTALGFPDFRNATNLAKVMVTKFGMSKEIGFVTYNYDDDGISNRTRLLIEEAVKQLLDSACNNAKTILSTHFKELQALVNALLEHETVTRSQIEALLSQQQQQPHIVEAEGSSQSKPVPPSPNPAASAQAATANLAATAAAEAEGVVPVDSLAIQRTGHVLGNEHELGKMSM